MLQAGWVDNEQIESEDIDEVVDKGRVQAEQSQSDLNAVLSLAPPREHLHFPNRLSGEWKIISLGPGTCTYRAVGHFVKYAFETPPSIFTESDFYAGKKRAKTEKDSLILLPCVHEVCAELYASPHWELLIDYWFHLRNPPLYLGGNSDLVNRGDKRCAAILRLQPLLADPDGQYSFEFIDVQTTQEAARAVMEGRCAYCITNIYGANRYGVEIVKELKTMDIGWYLFRYSPSY
jgi:hypothetical protein